MKSVIFNTTILALVLFAAPWLAHTQSKSAAAPRTLTGCLQTTDEEGEYALMAADGQEYRLFGTETANLAPHVGHKIRVTGTPAKPRMKAEEGGEDQHHDPGAERPHFNVSKVEMISKSCQ